MRTTPATRKKQVTDEGQATGNNGPATGNITGVIFDMCGVLVDWQPKRALEGLFPQEAIDDFLAEDDHCGFMYFDDLHDRGTDYETLLPEYEREYGARLGLMMRAYAAHADRALIGTMPGMTQLVADLKARGMRTWMLTNWGKDTWPAARSRFPELFGMMDGVVVSGLESGSIAKPDRAFFDLAVNRFGADRSRTLFVDDSPFNVEGARAAGLKALRFTSAQRTRAQLGL